MIKPLIIVLLVILVIFFVLWIIYIGQFANVSFFKLKHRLLSIFATSEKMDKFNQESINTAKENKKEITIIIHGAAANYYNDVYGTALWLREQGINAVSFDYDYKALPDVSAKKLSLFVDNILEQTKTGKVNIVGFCLGGNLAEYYTEKYNSAQKINKIITVLTPLKPMPASGIFYKIDKLMAFNPDPWNEVLLYLQDKNSITNVLHIYGTEDIIVSTKYQIPDKGNSIAVALGHSPLMTVDPKILNLVLDFINKK